MSNIKIVNDGFGRPKPVKEEEMYQYGLDVSGDSSAYHSNIFISGHTPSIVAISGPQPNSEVGFSIKSSAYISEGTRSIVNLYGSGYYDEIQAIYGGSVNIQGGAVYDSNWEETIASGASIMVEGASTSNDGSEGFGGSVGISSGWSNVSPGNIVISTNGGRLIIFRLPTSDPHIANQIWVDTSDGYTLKLSQG
jgi:hypothetical protein